MAKDGLAGLHQQVALNLSFMAKNYNGNIIPGFMGLDNRL
jgi:hypothetical protein